MKILACLLFVVGCGSEIAKPSTGSANPGPPPTAIGSGSASTDCPPSLNCQPPTNDKDPLCQLPSAELARRCPKTSVAE